jgi:hypothetical protein
MIHWLSFATQSTTLPRGPPTTDCWSSNGSIDLDMLFSSPSAKCQGGDVAVEMALPYPGSGQKKPSGHALHVSVLAVAV